MIYAILNDNFSMSELKGLADSLYIDWENLPGNTRNRKASEFANYMDRNNRSYELLAALDRSGKGLDLKPYLYLVVLDFFGNERKMTALLNGFGIEPPTLFTTMSM